MKSESYFDLNVVSRGTSQTLRVAQGTAVGELLPETDGGIPAIGALYNNEAVSLCAPVAMSGTLRALTMRDSSGQDIFRRTAGTLLVMAARRTWPDKRLRVRYSLGDDLFFTVAPSPSAQPSSVSRAMVSALSKQLKEIVDADLPITPETCAYEQAVAAFAAEGRHDEVGLLRHRNPPLVLLQKCAEFRCLRLGPLLPRTGLLRPFEIVQSGGGGVLRLPSPSHPRSLAPFSERPELTRIHDEHRRTGEILSVTCAGDLNDAVCSDRIADVMQSSEALHDKRFSRMADAIAARKPRPGIVLIAGPSSAGKTTSCKRLAIHLQVLGFRPVQLSTDDYFVPEKDDPIGPDGKPDYEHIRAVDVAALRSDMKALLSGREIRKRIFDFKTKEPKYPGDKLRLGTDDILLIEGIHALNPLITRGIPRSALFKIYLSALTQISLDDSNVLSTTDNRLVRRIVRDHFFRGRSARETISMWPSVRRGEERWIFPFQKEADIAFNSALDYEMAALRPFAETLLSQIKPSDPEYAVARRLQAMLGNFQPIPSAAVPGDSVLREYIGGSFLRYD